MDEIIKRALEEILQEKGSFSYDEARYIELKNKALQMMSERKFKEIEDEIVFNFLKNKNKL